MSSRQHCHTQYNKLQKEKLIKSMPKNMIEKYYKSTTR